MKTLRSLFLLSIAVGLTACGSKKADPSDITKLEKEVYLETGFADKAKAAELVDLYISFADNNKQDSLAPLYLYQAAKMSILLNKCDDSKLHFDRVIKDYPSFRYVKDAIFIRDNIDKITTNKAKDFNGKATVHDLIYDQVVINEEKASGLINLFTLFADNNKNDTLSSAFLCLAGELFVQMKKGKQAVGYFDRLLSDYPSYRNADYALYLKGFTYSELLQNLNEARKTYELLLQKYPESNYACIAKDAINSLGKTSDQILNEAIKKRQDSSSRK
jgi:TolA-binding protein